MKKIFLGILSLVVPVALFNLLILVEYLRNGSGIASTAIYEKYQLYWMISYFLMGLIHAVMLFKYLKEIHLGIKIFQLGILIGIYTCFLLYF